MKYFANIKTPKLILWCYLIWYLAITIQYFDSSRSLWLSSIGISALIGFALNLATISKDQSLDRWVVFRLYLFPFCVSSYSALIKGKGFFLLFPTDFKPLLIGIISIMVFLGFVVILKLKHNKTKNEQTSGANLV